MAKPLITEKAIRALANAKSFARGQEYYREGAVSDVTRRGNRVTAEVEGSELYEVTVVLDDGEVDHAHCTCPYDWDGYCKHVVAVLLKLAHASDEVTERPMPAELIRDLDRDDLANLLLKRLQSDRSFANWVETELAGMAARRAASSSDKSGKAVVDTGPIRKQAKRLLAGRYRRSRYADGYRGDDISELRDLVDEAMPFLESGDGLNALRVLESVADAFVDNWIEHSAGSDEDMYELFADLGSLVATAALMDDIPVDDRDAFKDAAEDWQSRLSEYGVEDAFDVAIVALQSGWDDPILQAILRGERKTWRPSGRDEWVEAELTALRLRALEACGKIEEYLRLAQAANARAEYAVMLVKLNRAAEAVKYALKQFKDPDETLELCKVLKKADHPDDALKVAEAGLRLSSDGEDDVIALAHWLREFAGSVRRPDLALKAAVTAFSASLSLEDFTAVKSWAGNAWDEMRDQILGALRSAEDAADRTEIFLSEGLIDEAVRSIEDDDLRFGAHDETLMRLAEAAHASHSDWVIKFAMGHATGIMEANDAGNYRLAAQWLEKAALAHEAAGREDAWMACLDELIERHRRKHKLRPLLQELRGNRDSTHERRKPLIIQRRRA
jgi:uncharacterized Zn finger protein